MVRSTLIIFVLAMYFFVPNLSDKSHDASKKTEETNQTADVNNHHEKSESKVKHGHVGHEHDKEAVMDAKSHRDGKSESGDSTHGNGTEEKPADHVNVTKSTESATKTEATNTTEAQDKSDMKPFNNSSEVKPVHHPTIIKVNDKNATKSHPSVTEFNANMTSTHNTKSKSDHELQNNTVQPSHPKKPQIHHKAANETKANVTSGPSTEKPPPALERENFAANESKESSKPNHDENSEDKLKENSHISNLTVEPKPTTSTLAPSKLMTTTPSPPGNTTAATSILLMTTTPTPLKSTAIPVSNTTTSTQAPNIPTTSTTPAVQNASTDALSNRTISAHKKASKHASSHKTTKSMHESSTVASESKTVSDSKDKIPEGRSIPEADHTTEPSPQHSSSSSPSLTESKTSSTAKSQSMKSKLKHVGDKTTTPIPKEVTSTPETTPIPKVTSTEKSVPETVTTTLKSASTNMKDSKHDSNTKTLSNAPSPKEKTTTTTAIAVTENSEKKHTTEAPPSGIGRSMSVIEPPPAKEPMESVTTERSKIDDDDEVYIDPFNVKEEGCPMVSERHGLNRSKLDGNWKMPYASLNWLANIGITLLKKPVKMSEITAICPRITVKSYEAKVEDEVEDTWVVTIACPRFKGEFDLACFSQSLFTQSKLICWNSQELRDHFMMVAATDHSTWMVLIRCTPTEPEIPTEGMSWAILSKDVDINPDILDVLFGLLEGYGFDVDAFKTQLTYQDCVT